MPKTDQFFKALVREFLKELLTLFFPDVASRLDFGTVRFLGTQVYTQWPVGLPRDVDVLAEVRTKEGEPAVTTIHVEVQARKEAHFPSRMHEYYMALRLRLRKPVFPIALLLTPNSGGLTTGRHVDSVLTREVATLNYAVVGLLDLREEDFALSNDPLAQALRSLMKTQRPRNEVVEEALNRLYGLDEAEGRKHMLAVLALEYSPLSTAEREALKERIRREEPEMHEWMTREEEQRYKTGKREGRREQLLRMIGFKFGPPDEATREAVFSLTPRQFETVSKRFVEARELADLGLPLN